MKIEIGESMMLSWLKHCKQCQVVQTNWKASTNTWTIYNKEKIEMIAYELKEHYDNVHKLDIFKKNKSINQIIQQGEIDVLGIEIHSGIVENIYGIDVAFHEGGLNYGNTEETVSRVVKKMIRTALTISAYFDLKRASIIFAAPIINNNVLSAFRGMIEELNTLFRKYDYEFKFELICNDGFKEQIFMPVIESANIAADTSELFMRSVQMYNIFQGGGFSTEKPIKLTMKKENGNLKKENNEGELTDIKVGQLVQVSFPTIIDKGLLSEVDIQNLQDKNYCKKVFNINYPLLKEIIEEVAFNRQRKDENGYSRYYAKTYRINGKQYLLCSQWYPWTKDYYTAWLKNVQD